MDTDSGPMSTASGLANSVYLDRAIGRPAGAMNDGSQHLIEITYRLSAPTAAAARAAAHEIAVEQTIEMPEEAVRPDLRSRIVGSIASVEEECEGAWRVCIRYDPSIVSDGLPPLLNLLCGNISMQHDILVTDLVLPPDVLQSLPGPQFGVQGVRELLAAPPGRPLLCTAIKPVGLGPEELADLTYRLGVGGIDIVKDDHSVTQQATAPFLERIRQCQEAADRATKDSGRPSRSPSRFF